MIHQKNPLLRVSSLTLAISMLWMDSVWALDPRQKLYEDQAAFSTLSDGKKDSGPAPLSTSNELLAMDAVSHQEALTSLMSDQSSSLEATVAEPALPADLAAQLEVAPAQEGAAPISYSQETKYQTISKALTVDYLKPYNRGSGWTIDTKAKTLTNASGMRNLDYRFTMLEAGDLKFDLQALASGTAALPAGYTNFSIGIYLDGVRKGALSVGANKTSYQAGTFGLTSLTKGLHTLRLMWENDAPNTAAVKATKTTAAKPATGTQLTLRNLVFTQQTRAAYAPSVFKVTSAPPQATNQKELKVSYELDGIAKEKTFTLVEDSNRLLIEDVDSLGRKVTASFDVKRDTRGPVLDVAEPPPALSNQPTLTVRYTSDGAARQKEITLAEGPNTYYILEKDSLGNPSYQIFQTTLDTVPPALLLMNAVPALTNRPTIVVDYTADGAARQKTFDLTEGDNTLRIEETDAAGNKSLWEQAVRLDTAAPVIEVLSQVPSLTRDNALTVRYRADGLEKEKAFSLLEGANRVALAERDEAGNLSEQFWDVALDTTGPRIDVPLESVKDLTNNRNLTFTYRADGVEKTFSRELAEGANEIVIHETDAAGNESVWQKTVTLDTVPPALRIVTEVPALTNQKNWEIKYIADGVERSKFVDLKEGENVFQIADTDAAGNVTTQTLRMSLDTVAPEVFLPLIPAATNQKSFKLDYTSDGEARSRTFDLIEGVNDLQIEETDAAGNRTLRVIQVTLDTVGPLIVVTQDVPELTRDRQHMFLYTVDGVQKERYLWLQEGANVLAFEETDALGNKSRWSKTVTLDTTPPNVMILVYGPSRTNQNTTKIYYSVDGGEVQTRTYSLVEGVNYLSLQENDAVGNVGGKYWQVTLDTRGPQIVFADGLKTLTNARDYELTYTADGAPAKTTYQLTEGRNVLTVEAADDLGNRSTRQIEVTLDTVAPVIRPLTPPPTATRDKNVVITYDADGAVKSRAFALEEGVNTVRLTETDDAGNTTVWTGQVTLDTTPPVLSDLSEIPALTAKDFFTVTYKADGADRMKTFGLLPGANLLKIEEADALGNTVVREFTVTRKDPPVLKVTGSVPKTSDQDAITLQYTLDGQARSKSFALKPGENVLTLRDTDELGQEAEERFWVTRTSESPLSADGFTLKTADNSVLTYQADRLAEVATADGNTLRNLRLDANGQILDAEVRLSDGSVQILENGAVVASRRPDGAVLYYRDGLLEKLVSSDGVVTRFTHDASGTTAENDAARAVYSAAGKLLELTDRATGKKTVFTDGVIHSVILADGTRVVFETQNTAEGLKVTAPAVTDAVRQELPLAEALYDAEGQLLRVTGLDGTVIRFEDGAVKSAVNAAGEEIAFDAAVSRFGNLVQTSLIQDSVKSAYDGEGNLSVVDTGDLVIHYKAGAIDFVETKQGIVMHDLAFYDDGTLKAARIVELDGGVKVYADGQLVTYLGPDGSKYYFVNGKMTSFFTPEKIGYVLDYSDDKIEAKIDPAFIPDLSTPVRMEYDAGFNLKSFVKKNDQVTRFFTEADAAYPEAKGKIKEVAASDGTLTTYAYLKDADGSDITRVTEGRTVTTYDASGNPVESTIAATETDPHTIRTLYKYGKIREVFKDGAKTLEYSYTYDNDVETTHIRDLVSNTAKDYRAGLLQTTLEQATNVLSTYVYDADNKVKEVKLSRLGRDLSKFIYTYEGDNTLVTDEAATTRVYNKDHKLVEMRKDGETRVFTYAEEADTELPDTLDLISLRADGAAITQDLLRSEMSWIPTSHDAGGRPVEYKRGSQLRRVTYDAAGRIATETVYEEKWVTDPPARLLPASDPTASSVYPDSDFSPAKAVDRLTGDAAFGWKSAGLEGGADSLIVDYGKEQDINKIEYDTRYGAAYLTADKLIWQEAFKISVSLDGVKWTEVVAASGKTQAELFTFTVNTRARYVKVHDIRSFSKTQSTFHRAYVSELAVFAQPVKRADRQPIVEMTHEYDAQGNLAATRTVRWTAPVSELPREAVVESGDFARELKRLKQAVADVYTAPTETERAVFGNLADHLMRRDWAGAAADAAAIGYELVLFRDSDADQSYLGFREKSGSVNRGWGSYFINLNADRAAIIEVPHPKSDLNTPELAASAFRESGAQALLIAGSDRNSSDAAHEDELFNVIHRSWNGIAGGRSVWQLHGYASANYPEFPAGAQAVISSGAAEPNDSMFALDQELESAGFGSYAFNRFAYDDARNVALNRMGDRVVSGTLFAGLGATQNEQGVYTRSLAKGQFIHIELSTEVRTDSASRGRAASAIAAAIRKTAVSADTSEVQIRMDAKTSTRTYQTDDKGALVSFADTAARGPLAAADSEATATRVVRKTVTREKMISRRLDDGAVAKYENGEVVSLTTADGLKVTDIVLDESRNLLRASAVQPDGGKIVFDAAGVLEEVLPDATRLIYTAGQLTRVVDPAGREFDYTNGAAGATTVRHLKSDLVYDAAGILKGLKLQDVKTPSEARALTTQSYAGGGEGYKSHDGDWQTAQGQSASRSFDRTQGNVQASVETTHTFPEPQTIAQIKFQMYGTGSGRGAYGGHGNGDWKVEYQTQAGGPWILYPQSSGGGSSGVVTLNSVISGVTAIRAYAHGYGEGSDQGGCEAHAYIYEFEYTLSDQSFYVASTPSGAVEFTGLAGTLRFDASGHLASSPANASLAQAAASVDGLIQNMKQLPHGARKTAPSPGHLALWQSDVRHLVLQSDEVYEKEYDAEGTLETQSKADKSVTLYNAAGKPEAVLNKLGEKIISYSYDADGNLEKVDLIEARRKLPEQISKSTADITAQRAESLRKLSESKALAIENIKKSAADARAQAQGYMGDLQNGMNSLGGTSVKGKQAKKAKSQAMDQYRDAMNQIQSQIAQIDHQEAEAYERLDNEVQSVSQQILTNAQKALSDLDQQRIILQNEILRQETTPVVFDVYRRILGRDPSGSDYQKLIDRLDYEKAEIITESAQRDVSTPLPSVTFDGSGDYLMLDDPYRRLTLGTADFAIDLAVNIQDIDRNQTLLDIGGWREGVKIAYQGSQRRLEWHVHGTEYGVWSFNADPSRLLRIHLERAGGILRMSVDGVQIHQTTNDSYINASKGVRIGYALEDTYYLRGAVASVRVQSAGTTLLDIAPNEKDEFVKDLTGNHTVYTKGNAALDPARSWLSRTDTVTEAVKTEKIAPVLTRELLATAEYQDRTVFVNAIKSFIQTEIPAYRALSEADREAYARALGLTQSQLIRLTEDDAAAIQEWIQSGTLHFGQSAFNAMELLLKQEGRSADKLQIAKRAILIDILTGVISPLDTGDLVISMFALKKTLSLSGMSSEAMKFGYNDLQKIYDDTRVLTEKVTTREYLPGSSVFINQGNGFARFEDLSRDADFGTSDFTVEAWVNHTGTGDFYPIASKSTNPSGWIFYIRNNQLGLYSNWNVGDNAVTVDISANAWHHVAVSRQGNTLRYFVDGKLAGQKIVTGNTYGGGDADIMIGGYNGWNSQRFHGRIDEFKATRKALYTEDFAPSDLRSDPDASVAVHIRGVDDGQGLALKDISQRHRTARIEGAVTIDPNNYKTRTLKVTEKTIITRGPPGVDLSTLSDAQKEALIQNPGESNPRLIAHIAGNHYVVLKNVTDKLVTYIDTSIGKDGENEVVTITRDEFEKIWQGYVLTPTSAVSQILDLQRAQNSWTALESIYQSDRVLVEDRPTSVLTPGSSMNFGGGSFLDAALPDDASLSTSDFTMDLWLRADQFTYPAAFLASWAYSNGINYNGLQISADKKLQVYLGQNYVNITSQTVLEANRWYHTALVREGSSFKLFVDGKLEAQATYSGSIPRDSGVMRIGSLRRESYVHDFSGAIDQFRFTKKALWQTNFTPPAERQTADAQTILLLYSDPVTGIKDYSSASRTVTPNNNPVVRTDRYAQSIRTSGTKKVIARYPVSVTDPSSLSAEEIQNILDHPESFGPKFTITTKDLRVLTILDMTLDEVTYLDSDNTLKKTTKEAFLSIWDGKFQADATTALRHETVLKAATEVTPALSFRALSDREAQSVRGAGLIGSILGIIAPFMNIIIPGSGFIFTLLSAAVNAIEGDFLSAIASIATLGFGGFADGFKGLFNGITQSLGSVGQMIGNVGGFFAKIFSPVTGFFNGLANNLHAFTNGLVNAGHGAIAGVVQTAVSVGVNIGVSKGLEVLGVSPEVSSLLGSFATGAISGVMEVPKAGVGMTEMIQKNVLTTNALYQGFQLGLELGLAPEISQILSLGLGAITGDISAGGNATGDIAQAFKNVMPNITSSMSHLGIMKLGENLGFDSRLTGLIGSPITGALGAGLAGKSVVNGIQDGILRGGISLGVNYAVEAADLDPMTGALSAIALSLAVEGVLSGDLLKTIDSTKNNLLINTATLGITGDDAWSSAQYLQRVQSFSSIIREKGLGDAMEELATQVMTEQSVNSILRSFGTVKDFIDDQIENDKTTTIIKEGEAVQRIELENGDYIDVKTVDGNKQNVVITEIRKGNKIIKGEFVRSDTGQRGLKDGTVTTLHQNGSKSTEFVQDGVIVRIEHEKFAYSESKLIVRRRAEFKKTTWNQVMDSIVEGNGFMMEYKDGRLLSAKLDMSRLLIDPSLYGNELEDLATKIPYSNGRLEISQNPDETYRFDIIPPDDTIDSVYNYVNTDPFDDGFDYKHEIAIRPQAYDDMINDLFASHLSFEPSPNAGWEAVTDYSARLLKNALGEAASKFVGKIASSGDPALDLLNKPISKLYKEYVTDILPFGNDLRLLESERMTMKQIASKFNQEINGATAVYNSTALYDNVTRADIQEKYGSKEIVKDMYLDMLKDNALAFFSVAAPVVGGMKAGASILTLLDSTAKKTQVYDPTQRRYDVKVQYSKGESDYPRYESHVQFRTGEYISSTGQRAYGVVQATYKQYVRYGDEDAWIDLPAETIRSHGGDR